MVGIVIVAHFDLAEKFLEIAEKILQRKLQNIATVPIELGKDINELKSEINKAIKKVDEKEGVLILTDMFGGTPCNISLAFLKEGAIEVLTGTNL
ncbi:MAG: PTS fructose transporter subunit IIA, partial [Desulfobacterota bacterium]|nr:PTS fructose transporter subunit IIA [Thermodesulfobacteriota bacterium]